LGPPVLNAETLHPEGPRYTASIVCVPGLWTAAAIWRPFASFLAHRGWECHLVDVRQQPGGIDGRAMALAAYAADLAAPPIFLGHDAGAIVGLTAARRLPTAAVVAIAPLVPGSRAARRLAVGASRLLALIVGRPVAPPTGRPAEAWLDGPATIRAALGADDATVVRDVAWGRVRATPAGVPTLVVAGDRDAVLPRPSAEGFARTVAGELHMVDGAGHWPFLAPTWQETVGIVHRWLVQRLGAALLDLYEEAMAERDADDD